MKLDSDFDPGHDESGGGEHDLTLTQPIAVDLRLGEVGDEVIRRVRATRRHFGGEEVAEFLEGGDMRGVAPLHGLVGRNRKDDLAPDIGMIAFRQAHGAKEQAHRDLTGKIVDELERFRLADARQRAVGNFDGRSNEEFDALAGESGLA